MEDKIRKMTNENASKIDILTSEIDNLTKITDAKSNQIKEMKVSLEKHEDIFNTYDS